MGRKKNVIVTDAGEDGFLRVTNEDGDQKLVPSDDPEGVAIAIDTLQGPYEEV